MILGYDIALARRQLIQAEVKTFQLEFAHLLVRIVWRREVVIQSDGLAFSRILVPDIFRYAITVSQWVWTVRARLYLRDHNVNRFTEQLIWVSTAFMNEVSDQRYSPCNTKAAR